MNRNPLNKRFLRDLRDDLGKYVVIALLMIFTIGLISGFLVADGSTIRVFRNRYRVDLVCLMEGEFPKAPGEIAVDRMYADNNGLKVGDRIRPADGEEAGSAQDGWVITGLVALSDYSAMFSDNNDTMFDAIKFGVAVCSPEEFAQYPDKTLYFNYAFKYIDPSEDEEEENDRGEELMKELSKVIKLENYVPRYANQAIRFTGERCP